MKTKILISVLLLLASFSLQAQIGKSDKASFNLSKKGNENSNDQSTIGTKATGTNNFNLSKNKNQDNKTSGGQTQATILKSDVDENIPLVQGKNQNRFALIIGNEDYSSFQNGLSNEVNVEFAANDAKSFKEYAVKTLGIPEENVKLLVNAKAIEMNREIKKLNSYAKTLGGSAELIFYYAGHGLPDENTKEPYLVPVDVSGSDLQFGVKLTDLYAKLLEHPSKRVSVFLDACFSGGARNQGLVAARGVKVKPKEDQLDGNIVVFTGSSGEQSSLPYKEKSHGLFTYFLLKKLQETKGNLSYLELSDYIAKQVGLVSTRVNNKEQNPQTNISSSIGEKWKLWRFR